MIKHFYFICIAYSLSVCNVSFGQVILSFGCMIPANAKQVYVIDGLRLKSSQFHGLKLKTSQIDFVKSYMITHAAPNNVEDTVMNLYFLKSLIELNNKILYTIEEKEKLKAIKPEAIISISNKKRKFKSGKIRVISITT